MLETHETSLPATPAGKGDAKVIVVMPARNEASSVSFRQGVVYGVKSIGAGARLVLHRRGIWRSKQFQA